MSALLFDPSASLSFITLQFSSMYGELSHSGYTSEVNKMFLPSGDHISPLASVATPVCRCTLVTLPSIPSNSAPDLFCCAQYVRERGRLPPACRIGGELPFRQVGIVHRGVPRPAWKPPFKGTGANNQLMPRRLGLSFAKNASVRVRLKTSHAGPRELCDAFGATQRRLKSGGTDWHQRAEERCDHLGLPCIDPRRAVEEFCPTTGVSCRA